MRKTSLFLILSLAVCACTGNLEVQDADEQEAKAVSEELSPLVEGTLTVRVTEETAAMLENSARTKAGALLPSFSEAGVLTCERVFPDAGEWEPRHREAGLHLWYTVTYNPDAEPLTKASSNILSIPGVASVEPVRRMKNTALFNDPGFGYQWDLYNDGTSGGSYRAGCDINVIPVWQQYTVGSSDVIVAVFDEGVDLSHPDLAANCIPAGSKGSKCFVAGYEGYKIYPENHGTHVAGTIAAINDNDMGVCGIAGGTPEKPGVKILTCQILRTDPDDDGLTIGGNSADALVWAADHGALIAQNSWGYVYATEEDAAESGLPGSLASAITYFKKNAGCDKNGDQKADSPMKGGIVIFAAGNEGWRHAWPAEADEVIAVGATGAQFEKAYYSNYGSWVDICAPGGDAKNNTYIYNTIVNGWGSMQGTSMACPHVSGVAALLVSYFGGPGFTAQMLKDKLLNGANKDKVPASYKIGPFLDAYGSFSGGSEIAPDKVTDLSSETLSNSLTFSWSVTKDKDDLKAYAFMFLMSKDKSLLNNIDIKKIPSGVTKKVVETGTAEVGDKLSLTFDDLDFETEYYATVLAYDYSNNYSKPSAIITAKTDRNNPPVISTDYDGTFKVKPFETLTVPYKVTDPDGHEIATDFQAGSDAAKMRAMGPGNFELVIVGKDAPAGKYSALFTAMDKYGAYAMLPIDYEILENHPPKVIRDIENILIDEAGKTVELNLADYITDEDGEPLTYSFVNSTQNVAQCLVNLGTLKVTSIGFGATEITVTASDACGKTCSTTFKVAVRDPSIPVLLYPNPVSTSLNVSTLQEMSADIRIVNKAGATVSEVSQNVSPFAPVSIDMRECPAGTYYVVFKGGSIDERYTIVKK